MKDPRDCTHETFTAAVEIHRVVDTGKFIADICIQCIECGEPFRFVGVPAGVSWSHPACSIDGLTLHAPIEPELEKQLQARASFEVPDVPKRH